MGVKPRSIWIILAISYSLFIGVLYLNNVRISIFGVPLLWVYMALWVLIVFTLLVILYIIDKRRG